MNQVGAQIGDLLAVVKSAPHLFFFNDTATTEIYTLSLHDALPIYAEYAHDGLGAGDRAGILGILAVLPDRKSTRLNSSHLVISYAVFCLKKKRNRAAPRHTAGWPKGRGPPSVKRAGPRIARCIARGCKSFTTRGWASPPFSLFFLQGSRARTAPLSPPSGLPR